MSLNPSRTVREFAVEMPNAARVFEKLKIDYCCGGDKPLAEACNEADLQLADVLQLLSEAESATTISKTSDFQSTPLAELTDYIIRKHHVFTADALERLTTLLDKVCSAHGTNHPELLEIRSQFEILRADLEPHMLKEERILFPYIAQLEAAVFSNRPRPFAPFGTVRNPITVMSREHDTAGEILRTIRTLSADFAVPETACISYQTLYKALEELEADLHQHIHLENNILFPRAVEIENKV